MQMFEKLASCCNSTEADNNSSHKTCCAWRANSTTVHTQFDGIPCCQVSLHAANEAKMSSPHLQNVAWVSFDIKLRSKISETVSQLTPFDGFSTELSSCNHGNWACHFAPGNDDKWLTHSERWSVFFTEDLVLTSGDRCWLENSHVCCIQSLNDAALISSWMI